MTQGIKIVTPGANINTTNPKFKVVDTTDKGSMKVYKVVQFNTNSLDEVYLNSGVSVGRRNISHDLGYSPAFMGFVYGGGSTSNLTAAVVPMPSRGPVGQNVPLAVYSSNTVVTVDGIEIPPSSGSPDTITVVIFKESLDTLTV